MQATVNANGQVTLPNAVRERLKVEAGGKVRFFFHPDGSVAILPIVPVTALRGILPVQDRAATLEDMEEAIASGACEGALPDNDRR